jgi:acetyltransferase-like isoleucine patch superfamily enzyme
MKLTRVMTLNRAALSRIKSHAQNRIMRAVRGPEATARAAGVKIGTGCRILEYIGATEPWMVTIGNRVTVTKDVTFITHDGSGYHVRDDRGRRYRYAPIAVGSDVFIGTRTIILPGVRIGDGAIIGAGTVLTRSVPPRVVVAGNPARIIRSRDEFDDAVRAWPAAADRRGDTYRRLIDSVAQTEFRPEMTA